MAPGRFEYEKPWLVENPEPGVCPHCKHETQPGDNVHLWHDMLWHTKPWPSSGTSSE